MLKCSNPEFLWNADAQWWEACIHCRRVAWEHEQSDPMMDMYNFIEQKDLGLSSKYAPPAMLSYEEYEEREKILQDRANGGKI